MSVTDIKATIDRVRELDKAATTGPWAPSGPNAVVVRGPGRAFVADTLIDPPEPDDDKTGPQALDNCLAIAFFRTAAPRLADECERLAKLLDKTKEANGNLSNEVARAHAVYLDIADSLLPSSTGPADLLAEIRRLQLREESNRNELACIYQMHSSAVDDRDTARAEVAALRAALAEACNLAQYGYNSWPGLSGNEPDGDRRIDQLRVEFSGLNAEVPQ